MGAATVFLIVVVVAVVAVAIVLLTGVGGKLSKDQQEGNLPGDEGEERPDHLAVSTDPDDTPERRSAPQA